MENYNETFKQKLTELKEEKQKQPTSAEKLKVTKEEIKETKHRIKALKANKYKSDSEEAELKELQDKLSDLIVSKANLQKKIENAKNNAIIHAENKKMTERKQVAINRVLEEEGIDTENGVKGLIALRRTAFKYDVNSNNELDMHLELSQTVLKYGIKNNNELIRIFESVKQNAPYLLNHDQ